MLNGEYQNEYYIQIKQNLMPNNKDKWFFFQANQSSKFHITELPYNNEV